MVACDVLIVGGGPAGSACAWKLRASGLRVAILDRAVFPRDKVCGGWITPAVLDELQIDTARYARGRVMQAITGFRIGLIGGRHLETHYGVPVSYGIRRCEFDDYLLKRCGAHLVLGSPFQNIERSGGEWIVNGEFRTPLLVGAGGTFCPVARLLGARVNQETLVAAQEAEFPIDESSCAVLPEVPELYFCPDMKGYGWCFRKGNVLNIGLGRMDPHGLSGHVKNFLQFLRDRKRVLFDLPPQMRGHAYLLYGTTPRNIFDDGALLTGDAAGLAYMQSGEGIRPAVESGLLAACAILDAQGSYSLERLQPYRDRLAQRFGPPGTHWAARLGRRFPASAVALVARGLLTQPWFTRGVLLDRWFLHREQLPLTA